MWSTWPPSLCFCSRAGTTQRTHEWAWPCANQTLLRWMVKSDFHIILKVLLFLCFSFNYLRKIHSELVGAENPTWQAGGSLLTPRKRGQGRGRFWGGWINAGRKSSEWGWQELREEKQETEERLKRRRVGGKRGGGRGFPEPGPSHIPGRASVSVSASWPLARRLLKLRFPL